MPQGSSLGKSGELVLIPIPIGVEMLRVRLQIIIQSTLPRKFSKLMYTKTVPKTDTGDQVE